MPNTPLNQDAAVARLCLAECTSETYVSGEIDALATDSQNHQTFLDVMQQIPVFGQVSEFVMVLGMVIVIPPVTLVQKAMGTLESEPPHSLKQKIHERSSPCLHQ